MSRSEWQGQLIVAAVISTITFIAYSSQIAVLWNFLGGASLHTILVLVPFNVFIVMVYVNYTLVCVTDPGAVPANWQPDRDAVIEVKRSTHAPRFCKTCNNYKPPRTHHCRKCGRCNLKMDHHCPWINTCVGFANYGHFIRFIVYVEISTIYLIVLLSCRLSQLVKQYTHQHIQPSHVEIVFIALNLFLSASVFITVGILSGYHVYCVATNTTTIEGWEKGRSLTLKSMGRVHNVMYPYDLGLYRNVCTVLGNQPLLWLWPQRMKGTGLDFEMSLRHLAEDTEEEKMVQGAQSVCDDDDDEDEYEENGQQSNRCSAYSRRSMQSEKSICVSIADPPRVKTRPRSTLRADHRLTPTTPASVATFASSSTLVDSHVKLPSHWQKDCIEMNSSTFSSSSASPS